MPSNLFPLVEQQELMEYQLSSTNLALTYQLKKKLQPILEEAWLSTAFTEQRTDDIIVKISKKGNLKICDSWRGISILPAISKIISNVILDRIKDHPYATIDRKQAGFRLDLFALTTLIRCAKC